MFKDREKTFNVSLNLDYKDALAVLRLIRYRQDDCRRVHQECPNYATFHEIDLELEGLKARISKQVPTMAEADQRVNS